MNVLLCVVFTQASLKGMFEGSADRNVSTPSYLLVSGSDDCTVRVWDVDTAHCLYVFDRHQHPITCLAVNKNVVFSGSITGEVQSWMIDLLKLVKLRAAIQRKM